MLIYKFLVKSFYLFYNFSDDNLQPMPVELGADKTVPRQSVVAGSCISIKYNSLYLVLISAKTSFHNTSRKASWSKMKYC